MLVNGGQPVNFNYPTFDQATGLFIAGTVYDVSTGTAVVVGSAIGMVNDGNGVYVGSFTPTTGKAYLVIMASYTSGAFTTVDTSRAPGASNYEAYTTDTSLMNFNYGAYDQAAGLTVAAVAYDVTDSSSAGVSMVHVAVGVYYGRYQGVIGKTYAIIKSPSDTTRPPGCDSFQCFTVSGGGGTTVVNNYIAPFLVVTGQSLTATLGGYVMGQIIISQGDSAVINLTATDGNGNPVNLTGAVFTTQIKGANGAVLATFGNSQHAIVSAINGTYTLTLATTDTILLGLGKNKEIVTTVVVGAASTAFHGPAILTVKPAVPLQ